MTDPLRPQRVSVSLLRHRVGSEAGSVGSLERPVSAALRGGGIAALERWVNEGGSLAADRQATVSGRPLDPTPLKEARDTAVGCRDRAVQDRLQAAAADTENGRRVLERSAASWESRAFGIEDREHVSALQRAADLALFADDERDDGDSPD
jgi:hypothetical protein